MDFVQAAQLVSSSHFKIHTPFVIFFFAHAALVGGRSNPLNDLNRTTFGLTVTTEHEPVVQASDIGCGQHITNAPTYKGREGDGCPVCGCVDGLHYTPYAELR